MIKEEGDFTDLVFYLAGLFQKKRLRRVLIDRFWITYKSCYVLDDAASSRGHSEDDFPREEDVESVRTISIEVEGLGNEDKCEVDISWEEILIKCTVERREAEDFIETLDRSTFRYF